MKYKIFLPAVLFLIASNTFAQNVPFSDINLKNYLLQKNCIDTDGDGMYDATADLNNDNEIQISEAESILELKIDDLYREYYIKSIQDIAYFKNLKILKIFANDSLEYIANLDLDSLTLFWLDGSGYSLTSLDISDLQQITNLRIEGPMNLSYLNIQNGSYASSYFSLFYTEQIQSACVDSIAAEYDEVVWHMVAGVLPQTACTPVNNRNVFLSNEFQIAPNPTTGNLNIEAKNLQISQISVFDAYGKLYLEFENSSSPINISHLPTGIYFIKITSDKGFFSQKIIKQ